MKFKHIALMSLALAASFSSCSDYLEQEPPSSLPSDGFFTSEAKVKAAADQFYGDVMPGHANSSILSSRLRRLVRFQVVRLSSTSISVRSTS